MRSKLFGLVSLMVFALPGSALAENFMTPWGMMNELGPWDGGDVARQHYRQAQPQYPTRPVRTAQQRRQFSRPINHASVDISVQLPEVPVYIKAVGEAVNYNVQMRVITPEFQAMSVVGYPAGTTPTPENRQLELTCEIESLRRWDRDNTRGWGVLVASTFNDRGTVDLLEKSKTVLMTHGVCFPSIDKRGGLSPKGVYEYHAAFVSRFEDSDQTGVMMEIGTGLHFNTAGNGYFERPRVDMAFTAVSDRESIRIGIR